MLPDDVGGRLARLGGRAAGVGGGEQRTRETRPSPAPRGPGARWGDGGQRPRFPGA